MTLLTRSRGRNRSFGTFSPSSLFLGGVQGAWYDPSDMTTLFQDAAGTTPVTAVEQPVGLVFDKRTAVVPRRNLLTYSEDFGNAVWNPNNLTLTTNATTAPDGTVTADLLVPTTGTVYHLLIRSIISAVSGATYVASYYVKPNGYTKCTIVENSATGYYVTYNLSGAGTVVSTSGATGTVTALENGWYRITHTSAAGGTTFRPDLWVLPNSYVSGSPLFTWAGDGTSGVYVWGAQLEAGSIASTYQKITSGIGGEWTPGNHAYQSTAASRPVLRARYNLLTYSEDFGNAAWTLIQILPFGSGSVVNAAIAPDGTTTADLITQNTSGTDAHLVQSIIAPVTGGSIITASVYLRKPTSNGARYSFVVINDMTAVNCPVLVDLDTGSVVNFTGYPSYGAPLSSSSVNVGGGWWRVTLSYQLSAGITQSRVFIGMAANGNPASSPIFTGDGTSGIYVWGAQLLTATDAAATGNAYQRIGASTDYATGGVFRPYLAFDGVDDSLATASVDLTSTSNVTVFAGSSKLSDASFAPVIESSTIWYLNTGTFVMYMPDDAAPTIGWGARASAGLPYVSASGFAAPTTRVVTGIGGSVSNNATLRVNGSVVGTNGVFGAGNFGLWPFYIGSRAGTSNYLNGRIYSLIVRGAASSAVEVSQTEAWVNAKTGAY